jgi:hypothetical protein
MVAMFEIVFVIVCAVVGLWWFRRTNIYRAHRRSGADPGQFGVATSERFGMYTRPEGPEKHSYRD